MPEMASKPPTKEELAQVRRMRAQKPWVSPEAIIQAAARTPNITRFIHAKQRQMRPVTSEASPIITPPETLTTRSRRSSARSVQAQRSSRYDETKIPFTSSKRVHHKDRVLSVGPSNGPLPRTCVNPRPESNLSLRVKERRDIYEFPEDERGIIAVTTHKTLPWLDHIRPSSKLLYAEQHTSRIPLSNTLSSHKIQEGGKFEERLNDSCQAAVSAFPHNATPQNLPQSVLVSRVSKNAMTKPQKIQSRFQQDKYIVKIDSEILHFGKGSQALPSAGSPISPIRLRSGTEKGILEDFGPLLNDIDGESHLNAQEPLPKRQKRSSRQIKAIEARKAALQELNRRRASKGIHEYARNHAKYPKTYSTLQKLKKKRRRIPVNELVVTTERSTDSGVDMTNSRQEELSHDPISQLTDEHEPDKSEREHLDPSLRMKINFPSRERIGAFDISLFRMPKNRSPLTATRVQQRANSCSDGFEGKEAAPTGVYMPVKRLARRFESYNKITIKFGQLTLVPDKPSSEVQVEQGHPRKRRIERCGTSPTLRIHFDSENASGDTEQVEPPVQPLLREYCLPDSAEVEHNEYQQLTNDKEEEGEAELRTSEDDPSPSVSLPEQNTPIVPNNGDLSEMHIQLVSPLERKQSAIYTEKMASQRLQRALKSSCQSIQGTLVDMEDFRITQQLATASARKQTSLRVRTEDLEVAQELMMVSVQKRPRESQYDSDSSDGSNEVKSAESYSDSESQCEEVSEEDGEELPPEDDSDENKNEIEEESQEKHEDESPVESRDLYLLDSVCTGFQASRGTALTLVKSNASVIAEGAQRFFLADHAAAGSRNNTVINPLMDLQRMASQRLRVLSSSPQKLLSLPDIDGRGIKKNASAVNSTIFQPNDPRRDRLADLDLGSTWHPRVPIRSGLALEVDHEIVDSAPPSPGQTRQDLRCYSSRRLSRIGSKELTIVRSRWNSSMPEDEPHNTYETQGSVELGCPRRNAHHSPSDAVFETQTSNQPEIPETQFLIEPQKSYLEMALAQLKEPIDRRSLIRTKSMPGGALFAQQEQSGDAVANGITMLGAFQHPISLVKTARHMPTWRDESANAEKSLSSLTRQASLNMGTLPGSTRKRVASFQLTRPPFIRSTL